MRMVRIEPFMEDGFQKGYQLDPDPYLNELPNIQADLPEGARKFALDGDHYNFLGQGVSKI